MKKYKVAVIGATGLVGQTFISMLEERNFPVSEFYPFASENSHGKTVTFNNKKFPVLTEANIAEHTYDIAFFSAGGSVSLRLAGRFVTQGALVIDNSSAFRMDDAVPLIIPEINGHRIIEHKGIIANPNCSTIQMLMAVAPLHHLSPVTRMVISTYQSVSGTGKNAMQELELQMKAYTDGRPSPPPSVYPHHIFNNCIPHIDKFMDNGNTFEEEKMIQETKKIMECSIPISVTCVRVPVLCSHGETVNITFKDSLTKQEICQALHNFSGVTVTDNPEELLYPLQHSLTGKNEVHVGRIRIDSSHPNSWNFWCVTDNIRKGAALNGIQIAEYWAENQI